jgi:hypothetical protein
VNAGVMHTIQNKLNRTEQTLIVKGKIELPVNTEKQKIIDTFFLLTYWPDRALKETCAETTLADSQVLKSPVIRINLQPYDPKK